MNRIDCDATRRREAVERTGLLVCLGIFAVILAAWALWWRFTNEPRVHLMLFFPGGVRGLAVGAPVKINGVPGGQVESIGVRVPSGENKNYHAAVRVVMNGDSLAEKGLSRTLDDPASLAPEITRGLRGRLRVLSPLTGQMYVELAYSSGTPANLVSHPDEGIAEVPSLPDKLSEGIVAASQKLAACADQNFEEDAEEMIRALDRIDDALDPQDARAFSDLAVARLATLRVELASPRLRTSLASFNADITDFRQKIADFDKGAADAPEKLRAATEKIRADMNALSSQSERFSRAIDPRSPAMLLALAKISRVCDEIRTIRAKADSVVEARGYLAALLEAAGDGGAAPSE